MKRIRKTQAALNLPTLKLEGSLFLPDQLEKAAQGRAEGQTEVDYGIPKGVKLKDEFSRAFQIACAQWQHFAGQLDRADVNAHRLTVGFVSELLRDALGYSSLQPAEVVHVGDMAYPISFLAGKLAVLVAPHEMGLEDADERFAVAGGGTRKKSAFQAMQELLNASPDHTWGMVSNGTQLRLLRDAASLTRPTYLEFDLADLLGGQRYAEFANVWRLLHASRASQAGGVACVWERWREAGKLEGTRVREGLRNGVEKALLTFGEGFLQHPANEALRMALHDGSLSKDAYFQQLLRLIYRLIFIFTVEERGVLHPLDDSVESIAARKSYAEGYALSRMRELCLKRRARNRHDDYWQAIRIIWRGLAHGQARLALPALGGLFATDQCSHLDASSLQNAYLLAALKHLRWAEVPQGRVSGLVPVDYRNMGPEELGSVYESLLELVPTIDLPSRTFGFVGITEEGSTAGNARKTSGSYYTPDSLVQELIKSALDPLIEQRLGARPDNPTEALLSIRVMDPACGSGHFLLAAARRLAEKLAQLRSVEGGQAGAVRPQDYRHALREVVARCIFGVDRNPMAIELARTALWLEGFEEGRPLTFLDHHLQVGDALLGLTSLHCLEHGIAKDAFKALSGDDKEVCKVLAKANTAALKQLSAERKSKQARLQLEDTHGLAQLRAIEALPEGSTAEIEVKAQAYAQYLQTARTSYLAAAADALLGAYLLPKTEENAKAVPTTTTLYLTLQRASLQAEQQAALAAAQAACRHAKVFHWPLAFPQVFAQGGFDCVLGNPPWERIKLQEEEFFATRHRDVAEARNKAERAQRIQWLSEGMLARHLHPELTSVDRKDANEEYKDPKGNPEIRLYDEFVAARRTSEAASLFAHVNGADGGRYPLTGVGDVNTYALFAETILQIHASDGRAGFIVPTGIATDDSTKALFGHLTSRRLLARLISFYEVRAWFKATDDRKSFCLLTLGQTEAAEFLFDANTIDDLQQPEKWFTLSAADFRLINPNTLTCPVFRSKQDAELTKKLYRVAPVLIKDEVIEGEGQDARVVEPAANPWGISFMRMLDMSNDSHLFSYEPAPNRLPLYEAKLVHQFDHRWATYTPDGNSRDMTLAEKQDPATLVVPRYWVSEREVWLRTAHLPEGLLKALKDRNQQTIVLCATQLLFGWWLADHRSSLAATGMYPSWQKFVQAHPYAKTIAPTSLGLVGNNPACIQPLNDDYLPAEGEQKVVRYQPGSHNGTAWYMTAPSSVQAVIDYTSKHRHLTQPLEALTDSDSVEALAEKWLIATSPKWLMGWRDIALRSVERTVIASVMPLAGVGHTMPLLSTTTSAQRTAALLANLCSLTLDYCARVKVGGTHLTYGYLKQFPVLPPERYTDTDLTFIVPRVLELTYTSHDLSGWAHELGFEGEPFAFEPDRRAGLRAELDAYYARLYGLSKDELRYILDPEEVMGEGYPSETFRVLKTKEKKEHGEYRTQTLVLAAWDQLDRGELH